MVKYIKSLTNIVFEEIPDMVTLAVSISNCQNNCFGCHSSFLKKDIGDELDEDEISRMIEENYGINCFLFLGEGNDINTILSLNDFIKAKYGIETAIYSGRDSVEDIFFDKFDFVKVGSYNHNLGPLNKRTTNQRLYHHGIDITDKFWKNYKE